MAEEGLVTYLSVASFEGEQDTLQGLKSKFEEMVAEQNKFKTNVSRLDGDVLYKNMQMKAISFHVERLEENGRNIAAENESMQVTKREIIALQMNYSRPKRSGKATKMIAEGLNEQ